MEQIIHKMKKKIVSIFKNETHLTFAIKRELLKNGSEVITPVVKRKGWMERWVPIVKVNDTQFEALDLPIEHPYTEKQCIEYINGYKEQALRDLGNKTHMVHFEEII